jgi:hypothetical protein
MTTATNSTDLLKALMDGCAAEDAATIIHCLCAKFPEATVGVSQIGGRQLEILAAIEAGANTSPLLQKALNLTGNNICTQISRLEAAGLVLIDSTYRKRNTYRRLTTDEILQRVLSDG